MGTYEHVCVLFSLIRFTFVPILTAFGFKSTCSLILTHTHAHIHFRQWAKSIQLFICVAIFSLRLFHLHLQRLTFKVNIEEKKLNFSFFIRFDDFIAFNSVLCRVLWTVRDRLYVCLHLMLDWNDAMRCVYLEIDLSINLLAHIICVDVTVIVQRKQKKVSISGGFIYLFEMKMVNDHSMRLMTARN